MIYIFIAALFILALTLQSVTLRHSLDKVSYDLRTSNPTAECGESFLITTTLENKKRFPVMFLKVSENLPLEITVDTGGTGASCHTTRLGGEVKVARLTQTLYLMPRQRYSRRLSASLPKRGRYFFRGAMLTGGDLLGLKETSANINRLREMVVLPRRVDAGALKNAFGNYLGDVSVRRFILEDPILTVGFREYTGREPMKAISWPRSARDGRLMVKQYDYTQEMTATVILNVRCPDGSFAAEDIERGFSLARFACEELESRRIAYDFLTNATAAGAAAAWSSVSGGLGAYHLSTILEGLGRATYDYTEPFEATLLRSRGAVEQARAVIVISPGLTDGARLLISRLESSWGGPALIIDASEEVAH